MPLPPHLRDARLVRSGEGYALVHPGTGKPVWHSGATPLPASALGRLARWGSEGIQEPSAGLPDAPGPERDAVIFAAATDPGSRPRMIDVTSESEGHTAVFHVFAEPLKVGGVRASVSATLAQRIADVLDCSLLTAKLADLLYAQRTATLPPHTQVPDKTMVTTRVMTAQSAWLDDQIAQLQAAGADVTLVGTLGKHWIVDNLMAPASQGRQAGKAAGKASDGLERAINYGWHLAGPTFQGSSWGKSVSDPTLYVIQGRGWAHSRGETDYSQTCILVSNDCVLDGRPARLQDVLTDPETAMLANADGVLRVLRQPGVPLTVPSGSGGGGPNVGDDVPDVDGMVEAESSLPAASSASGSSGGSIPESGVIIDGPGGAKIDVSKLSTTDALKLGVNLLATASGVAGAAGLIAQSIENGDWVGAGQEAYQDIQSVAAEHGGDAMKYGMDMAAKFTTAGAAAGALFGPVGSVVGALVGAILGFVAGVGAALTGNLVPTPLAKTLADHLQDGYESFPSAVWFHGSPKTRAAGIKGSLRDEYFKGLIPLYRGYQGSGPNPSLNDMMGSLFDKSKVIPDAQPALDMWLSGQTDNGPSRPLVSLDYALWLATQNQSTTILKSAPEELQSVILPLMPMALATTLYMTYVPVIAAAACYSPLALKAVRDAAMIQGSKLGPQVAQCLALSLPPDDVTLLLYAYHFVRYDGDVGDPRTSHRPLQVVSYMAAREGMWGKDSPVAASLATILGQALWGKTRDLVRGKALLATMNAGIEGAARLNPGRSLTPGKTLSSPNGSFSLEFQKSDGNLVLYWNGAARKVLWSANTAGKGATSAMMQGDGNFVVYAGKKPLWATSTMRGGSYLAVQDDGNLVVYLQPGVPLWASNSANGSMSSGVPISPAGVSALYVALVAASKKPVVSDCLAGLTERQVDLRIGLTPKLGGLSATMKSFGPQVPKNMNLSGLQGMTFPPVLPQRPKPLPPPAKPAPLVPPRLVKPLVVTGGTVLASLLGWAIFRKPSPSTPRF